MDLSRQVGLYGTDQSVQPPDTQLAAGPTYLAEADNNALSIWTKAGSLVMSADLNVFFSVPAGYSFTDPRILYDAESSRWFLSGFAVTPTADSKVYLAVSTSSDPTASWNTYVVASGTGVIADQPMSGVDTDKVVLSWNDFSGSSPATTTFSGQETWVLQKSDLLSVVAPHASTFGPDAMRFRVVPAQSLTPTTTEWLTYNTGGPSVGVVAITGTPLAANVMWTESDPALTATSKPPQPRQPSGVPVDQAIDDRFLSSVWQNGMLWVSGNDGCIPTGDSTARSCLKLVQISTGATPTVDQDFDAAELGIDLYYPAVTVDSSGDLFVGYSASSPTLYPGAYGVDSLAASPASLENVVTLASGMTSYVGGAMPRWGDYSGAAQDPSNPADVWLTAEYQASSTLATDWGTATARLAIQPSITSVSPNNGSVAGGTPVTITGAHFQTGASVLFGSNAATNVVVVSGTQITATSPAGAAGPVDVTVNQPDGTTVTASSAFTYVARPIVSSVVPSGGPSTGGTSVTISGENFTGATAVNFGAVAAATFTVNSATQITAVSPAQLSGVVDITVTAPPGTSTAVPADRYTYSQVMYFNWFDKASPGMFNDNIHLLNTGASSASVTVGAPGAASQALTVGAGAEAYVTFPAGTIGGPVVVTVTSGPTVLASQRVQYYSSFNEVWAESAAQAATTSYINWYDKASPGMFNDNIHLLNPGGTSASVSVSLPGAPTQTATVLPGAEAYVTFPAGTIGGPVTVSSTQPVLASQRVQYYSTFNEVWAEPGSMATATSYLNWYDKASPGMFGDNIHLLNPGASSATVTVSLPGATSQVATVGAGAEAYVTFPAGNIGGPVTVSSTQPVLASQRVQYNQSFNEVWAEGASQAATTSYINWFDKASPGMFNDNIHLLNPGGTSATVTVSLPGATSQMVTVAAGAEAYVTFPAGMIGGPVTVSSTQPVLASQRVQYYSTFNEIWSG